MTYVEFLFICPFAIYIFLVRCLVRSLVLFLLGLIVNLLSFKSRLYILDNSPLSDLLLQIFSPACGLSSSLDKLLQKFFFLLKCTLSIISFMDHVFDVVSKKASPYPRSSRFSPRLSSKEYYRASLVAQWLRICLLMQGTRVRALVWEDPTCHGAAGPVSHNY